MDKTKVVVQIAWNGEGSIGGQVFEVYFKNILEAVRANSADYDALDEIRKAAVLIQMEVENLQGQIKFPNLKRPDAA